jgi:molybdenum cofactor synthesis domain-containing protein
MSDRRRAAVITVSTSKSRGEGTDESGPRLAELASGIGAEVVSQEIVTDDRSLIEDRLRFLADQQRCDLVLTTGGTGFAPSDVTPEATLAVVERQAPGIPEASTPPTGCCRVRSRESAARP